MDRESEHALGDGDGQGSLACCSPWGHKKSDMTEQMKNNGAQSHPPTPQVKPQWV